MLKQKDVDGLMTCRTAALRLGVKQSEVLRLRDELQPLIIGGCWEAYRPELVERARRRLEAERKAEALEAIAEDGAMAALDDAQLAALEALAEAE